MRFYCLLVIIFPIFVACASTPSRIAKRIVASDESSVAEAINSRSFPSIFQAWVPLTTAGAADPAISLAQHDLIWQGIGVWGLKCANATFMGLCISFSDQSVAAALRTRDQLKQINPHIVLLAEIRYHDASAGYLPADSPWWARDTNGNRIPKTHGSSTNNYFMLDFTNSDFQNRVADLCKSVILSGVVDGCMFDWWNNETPAHVTMIKKIRATAGDSAILIANVNGTLPKQSAPLLNGIFMEGFGAPFFSNWQTARSNLIWANSHFRAPVITALDGWGDISTDGKPMRFSLALSLVFSNGYFIWGNQLHSHIWHQLWNKELGRPLTVQTIDVSADGSYRREYENGIVVLNPPNNTDITLDFTEQRTRASTNAVGTQHILQSGDGDLFLK